MRKNIIGYEGLYDIDINGNIYSLQRKQEIILKPGKMSSGYKMVSLVRDGVNKSLSIHRLLAIHFIPNPNNLPQVNHIDGNKTNNSISNLEWCTRSHNMKHMYDNGLKKYKPLHYKGKFGVEHNRSKAVLCIENGVIYSSFSEAEKLLNIGGGGVSYSIKNKVPIKGFTFDLKKL